LTAFQFLPNLSLMPQPNGTRIREARQDRGWSLGDLADKARIKKQHLANIESGHSTASIEALQRLADALDLKRDDLVAAAIA
jgi:ribosome-binding protein aMBF1 (putative translation factor)